MAWKADKRPWVKPATYATYNILINSHLAPYFGPIRAHCALGPERAKRPGLCERGAGKRAQRQNHPRFPAGAQDDSQVRGAARRVDPLRLLCPLPRLLRTAPAPAGAHETPLYAAAAVPGNTGLVHIRRTVQHIWIRDGDVRADWMEIGMPKTATSVRDIPLSREIQELLRPAKKASKPGHYVVTGSPEPLEPRWASPRCASMPSGTVLPPAALRADATTKPYRPSWATPPSPPPWTSTSTPAPPRSAA